MILMPTMGLWTSRVKKISLKFSDIWKMFYIILQVRHYKEEALFDLDKFADPALLQSRELLLSTDDAVETAKIMVECEW
jgi:hypothetical protein